MASQVVEVGGRRLELSNLDKVLFHGSGTTKGEVVDYYARIAPVMLAHIGDRALTFRRAPDGVDGPVFFTKRCPDFAPDWIATARGLESDRAGRRSKADRDEGPIDYCVLGDVASLVWAANLAALELHAPMARASDPTTPSAVVFDLDPGEPAGITECCAVALLLRDAMQRMGLTMVAKTSGNKGLQVYLPLNTPVTHDQAGGFAHSVAELMTKHHPELVVNRMTKKIRAGKVFIDWSQNNGHKTTIGAYSLRIRETPTVSTPVTWDEVEATSKGAPLSFVSSEVLERVETLGDLFAPAARLEQQLPGT